MVLAWVVSVAVYCIAIVSFSSTVIAMGNATFTFDGSASDVEGIFEAIGK